MRGGQQTITASRYLALIAIGGCIVAGLTVLLASARESLHVAARAFSAEASAKAVAVEMIQVIDGFLIATVFYVVAIGMYELFIDDRIQCPDWMRIHTLDDLKNKVIRLVVVVVSVDFLSEATQSKGDPEILQLGAAMSVVIVALTVFLRYSVGAAGEGKNSP